MTLQQLLLLFVSLFALFSPLANVGPFASLVGHFPRADQRKLAFTVFVNCLVVMLLFVWVGEALFSVLGINSNSLSVTGGIALMIAGLPMMLGTSKPEDVEEGKEPQTWRDMAVMPMTFPMSIGGTTAAYIVTASGFAKNTLDLVAISAVVVLFGVVIWLTHLFSPPLAAKLNPDARVILNRIGGIVLVTISVQLLASGLKGLFPVLAG
jgi:multiple antibiotic resistance protein